MAGMGAPRHGCDAAHRSPGRNVAHSVVPRPGPIFPRLRGRAGSLKAVKPDRYCSRHVGATSQPGEHSPSDPMLLGKLNLVPCTACSRRASEGDRWFSGFPEGARPVPNGGKACPRKETSFPSRSVGWSPDFNAWGAWGNAWQPWGNRLRTWGNRLPHVFRAWDHGGESLPLVVFCGADMFSESASMGQCLGSFSPTPGSRMQAVEPIVPATEPSIQRMGPDSPRLGTRVRAGGVDEEDVGSTSQDESVTVSSTFPMDAPGSFRATRVSSALGDQGAGRVRAALSRQGQSQSPPFARQGTTSIHFSWQAEKDWGLATITSLLHPTSGCPMDKPFFFSLRGPHPERNRRLTGWAAWKAGRIRDFLCDGDSAYERATRLGDKRSALLVAGRPAFPAPPSM